MQLRSPSSPCETRVWLLLIKTTIHCGYHHDGGLPARAVTRISIVYVQLLLMATRGATTYLYDFNLDLIHENIQTIKPGPLVSAM